MGQGTQDVKKAEIVFAIVFTSKTDLRKNPRPQILVEGLGQGRYTLGGR